MRVMCVHYPVGWTPISWTGQAETQLLEVTGTGFKKLPQWDKKWPLLHLYYDSTWTFNSFK